MNFGYIDVTEGVCVCVCVCVCARERKKHTLRKRDLGLTSFTVFGCLDRAQMLCNLQCRSGLIIWGIIGHKPAMLTEGAGYRLFNL